MAILGHGKRKLVILRKNHLEVANLALFPQKANFNNFIDFGLIFIYLFIFFFGQ